MAKSETRWICQQCGWSFSRHMGKCPHCGAWDSLVETPIEPEPKTSSRGPAPHARTRPQLLSQVETTAHDRIPVPLGEFARVLGGGLVPGSIVLIGGEPGIGKSTLLLQVAALLGTAERPVLYVSGEESPRQLKMRAQRLSIAGDTVHVLPETGVEAILAQADALPRLQALVVDSIQTAHTEGLNSTAGSVSQVRTCAS